MAVELFNVFQTYWQAGLDARLNLECHAGKVWMHLQVQLNHPPPPLSPLHGQPKPPPPYRRQPRQSPSRVRRRARRAEARAAARAAVNGAAEDVAVEHDPIIENEVAVPLKLNHPDDQQPHKEAEEVAMPTVAGPGHILHVPDLFCPDKVYHDLPAAAQDVPQPPHQDTLPQLDGHAGDVAGRQEAEQEDEDWINPDPVTGSWVCRCCYYAHNFISEDELRKHHNTLSMQYEDCNICYPWHVWI